MTFLYNTFLIFFTFSIAYLVKRRIFVYVMVSIFWLATGITSRLILTYRTTPFTVTDLGNAGVGGVDYSKLSEYRSNCSGMHCGSPCYCCAGAGIYLYAEAQTENELSQEHRRSPDFGAGDVWRDQFCDQPELGVDLL